MEKARKSASPEGDRLSSLHDHVLMDGIFVLLTTEDLIRLSQASKRFEELCTLTPSVDVDMDNAKISERSFMKFLEKCIYSEGRSDGKNPLRHLRIKWKLESFYRGGCGVALRALLCQALGQGGLECLSLDLSEYCLWKSSPFELDIYVDSHCYTSLKHLDLNFHHSTLQLPIVADVFPNLECLEMQDIKINDDSFYYELSAFKFLKQLVLINVFGQRDVYIASSSLERFRLSAGIHSELLRLQICGDKLSSVHVKWNVDYLLTWRFVDQNSLEIVAPNLIDLELETNVQEVTVNSSETTKVEQEESSESDVTEQTEAEDTDEEQDITATGEP